jgi:hypothetical protein
VSVHRIVPMVLVLAIAGFAGWSLVRADDDQAPVEVRADGPRFDELEEMGEASDLVVDATVVAIDDGRTITDPTDPTAGFTTWLIELEVNETLRGPSRDVVILEQEATLLDGAPIVVNGMKPAELGQRAVWFLVAGDGEQFPYFAVINEQGVLTDGEIHPDWGPAGVDDIRLALH